MVEQSSPEEHGRVLLEIYAHFDSRPGKELGSRNFLAVGRRRRVSASDLQKGTDFALEKGWIEETEEGFLRLTEAGFAEMIPTHQSA